MGVAQIDNGYAAFDAQVINRSILTERVSRTFISESGGITSLPEVFQTVQSISLSGDLDYVWEYVSTNSTGGVLVKGIAETKFHTQAASTPCGATIIDFGSKLNFVKDTFALTNEQLSDVLRSGRKSVHNWMNNLNRPNKTKAKRILTLDNLANLWGDRGYSVDRDILLAQSQSGNSLLEILAQEDLDKDLVLFHGASLYLEQGSYLELEDPFA
ncbi:hypothetical protein [Shewanella sp. SM32]|uniref:hypothetical protein n=1 Tax=Shewanella sp. SM32 TaxID=2912796 RepID=UPI0021D83476|nr:hypothetical protein [Shewanella sp. SM32]MCU8069891.1 hypothetical protein [Shewanella sp. SM32]